MFSLEQYKQLIIELMNNNLTPTTDWIHITSKNTLLIRHDIDFSVDFAHKLAVFESELEGVYNVLKEYKSSQEESED